MAPLKADLALDLRNVNLLPLQPYVLEQTKIAISRGNLTAKGISNSTPIAAASCSRAFVATSGWRTSPRSTA